MRLRYSFSPHLQTSFSQLNARISPLIARVPILGPLYERAKTAMSGFVRQAQAAAGTGTINNANPAMVLNFPHGSTGPARI